VGEVFSISSDTFYEPLLGHTILIKRIKALVKPPGLREILGENTNNYCRLVLRETGRREKKPLHVPLYPGQFYLDYPQVATLCTVLGLTIFHRYISFHYYTKLKVLIVFAFNNRSFFSRLTSPWLQLEFFIPFFLNCM